MDRARPIICPDCDQMSIISDDILDQDFYFLYNTETIGLPIKIIGRKCIKCPCIVTGWETEIIHDMVVAAYKAGREHQE